MAQGNPSHICDFEVAAIRVTKFETPETAARLFRTPKFSAPRETLAWRLFRDSGRRGPGRLLQRETDFYTPPVLGGAPILPFSAPAVYKNLGP